MAAEYSWPEVAAPPQREPLPGDFLLFHFARCYSHGVIVIEWPLCIHAHVARGVVLIDALRNNYTAKRVAEGKVKAWDLFTAGVEDSSNVR